MNGQSARAVRDHAGDITPLAGTFLREPNALFDEPYRGISVAAWKLPEDYTWPRNV